MPDTNAPSQRGDDEPDDTSIEERMRRALGKLGTKTSVGQGRPAGTATSPQTWSQRRARFARDGKVPVERVTTSRGAGRGSKSAISRQHREWAEL